MRLQKIRGDLSSELGRAGGAEGRQSMPAGRVPPPMAGAPVCWLVGVWARRVKGCPFKLLCFNYLFTLYLLEGEVGGVGRLVSF